MDTYIAVFNVKNEEIKKARRAFNAKFGKGSYVEHISKFHERGIMSIFQESPTEKTRWYVEYVAKLVNDRLEKNNAKKL